MPSLAQPGPPGQPQTVLSMGDHILAECPEPQPVTANHPPIHPRNGVQS